ncbi:hypothetical protein N824_27440 [Pedobacter sp. V48]|nr:hypothetical protein N824_27440 [Pedobacter sp. V48]
MYLFKQFYKTISIQLATLLRTAIAMFLRFLSLQYGLGDSFLKSSKDFIK